MPSDGFNMQYLQASVTLTVLNNPDTFPARKFKLYPGKAQDIGRSGKGSRDRPAPARENAFFDSPVISRQHAQLFLDQHRKLSITDLGSLHGTFVNCRRIKAMERKELHDGDQIEIGGTVISGNRSFPARKFKINYTVEGHTAPLGRQEPASTATPLPVTPVCPPGQSATFVVPDSPSGDDSSDEILGLNRDDELQILEDLSSCPTIIKAKPQREQASLVNKPKETQISPLKSSSQTEYSTKFIDLSAEEEDDEGIDIIELDGPTNHAGQHAAFDEPYRPSIVEACSHDRIQEEGGNAEYEKDDGDDDDEYHAIDENSSSVQEEVTSNSIQLDALSNSYPLEGISIDFPDRVHDNNYNPLSDHSQNQESTVPRAAEFRPTCTLPPVKDLLAQLSFTPESPTAGTKGVTAENVTELTKTNLSTRTRANAPRLTTGLIQADSEDDCAGEPFRTTLVWQPCPSISGDTNSRENDPSDSHAPQDTFLKKATPAHPSSENSAPAHTSLENNTTVSTARKRKADEISTDDTEHCQTQEDPATSVTATSLDPNTPSTAATPGNEPTAQEGVTPAEGRPFKRLRFHERCRPSMRKHKLRSKPKSGYSFSTLALGAVVGGIVGGISVMGALISLPESLF